MRRSLSGDMDAEAAAIKPRLGAPFRRSARAAGPWLCAGAEAYVPVLFHVKHIVRIRRPLSTPVDPSPQMSPSHHPPLDPALGRARRPTIRRSIRLSAEPVAFSRPVVPSPQMSPSHHPPLDPALGR